MKTLKNKSLAFFFALLFLKFSLIAVSGQIYKTAILRAEDNSSHSFYQKFNQELAKQNSLRLIDEDLSRTVARALNYKNLFNLSLDEAKNLGVGADCDFFFVVKAETLKRSSFQKDVYFESHAIIFLVSARSGRLISWENASFEADKAEAAEKLLLTNTEKIATRLTAKISVVYSAEKAERAAASSGNSQFLEISDSDFAKNENIRTPLPYKRLRPAYTEAADKAQAEATVDALVYLNAAGEVEKVEILRWAGFGLDEETVSTIQKMQYRPALKDEKPIAVQFLLRYNFRRLQE